MASKRILKELKDLQKDPPTSCSAAPHPLNVKIPFVRRLEGISSNAGHKPQPDLLLDYLVAEMLQLV